MRFSGRDLPAAVPVGYHEPMRVIAGQYRRRLLQAPEGLQTRPTSDRLRETLFNVLAPHLEGARFLDLYAGSGANGIEALSRGAGFATFIEQAAPALAAIRANLAALKIARGYTIHASSVAAWLRGSGARAAPAFEIVFLDPPYEDTSAYAGTLGLLGGQALALLAPGAIVVAEHRRVRRGAIAGGPEERYGELARTRVLEQGDAALSFYTVRDAQSPLAVRPAGSPC